MRHVYVNRASYLIATLLLLGVFFIAWLRSEGVFLRLLEDAQRQGITETPEREESADTPETPE